MRIGHGYDVHSFTTGQAVVIGGIRIPHNRGVKAHSDGDVLLHAIGDALLGAAALGDLGQHFPDTDPTFRNIDSSELLRHIVQLIHQRSYRLINLDATVVAERPKLAPHIDAMRQHIAHLLHSPKENISVKATTHEKMGWIGRGEGLAAQAVVLLDNLSSG